MKVNFNMRSDEDKVTPIKIAEALINDSDLSHIELDELGDYLITFAKYARRKKMAERHPEEDF